MITRIKIDGFKSLLDTDLYLGPFTCIAGPNAVGKSNFFDVLVFLSNLADNTLLQAAKSVRSEHQKHSDIRDIFFRQGSTYLDTMSFEVDMIVNQSTEDDLGQKAEATITSLRYTLQLRLNNENSGKEPIELIREELLPITQGETTKSVHFEYAPKWLKSILAGRRSTKIPFISVSDDGTKIKLHQDGSRGRTTEFVAEKMPRTLISTVTAESPTAFLARKEMRNWMMLQFEPSSLRQPNSVFEVKNAEITASGLNLPATLYRLSNERKDEDIYQIITNKLRRLVDNVQHIDVDRDEKRDLLTLQVGFKGGLELPAQSLSDGTLRFLGLAIIEEDTMSSGLLCLEEPENGINPLKVQAMVDLLEGMATNTTKEVDEENPLRQVIINTHSPKVVSAVSSESLYLARVQEKYIASFNGKVQFTGFAAVPKTWRTEKNLSEATTHGEIIRYLDDADTPTPEQHTNAMQTPTNTNKPRKITVREYYHKEQLKLKFPSEQ